MIQLYFLKNSWRHNIFKSHNNSFLTNWFKSHKTSVKHFKKFYYINIYQIYFVIFAYKKHYQ